MKFRLLFFSLLTCKICCCQLSLIDTNKYAITIHKLFASNTSYGWFTDYLNNNKNYFDFLESYDDYQFYYFRIDKNYDTLKKKLITFQEPIESFIATNNSFFVISSFKTTTSEPSHASLSKYDSNWKKLWTKTITSDISPDNNFVMTLNSKQELLIFSSQYLQDSAKSFKVFEKRDLNGELLHKQKIELAKSTLWLPNNVVMTHDNNFLLTSVLFNVDEQNSVLELHKINNDGKIIWTKCYSNLKAVQTLILKNGNIVLYGNTFDDNKQSNTYLHKKLKIILADSQGNKVFQKVIEDKNDLEPGSVSETQDGKLIFSSSINPNYGLQNKNYVFELDLSGNIVYGNVIDKGSSDNNNIVFPTKGKVLLGNTQYHPFWFFAHNCFFNFLSLTKQQ